MKKAVLKNFAIFAGKQLCWQKIKLMLSDTLSLNIYLIIMHILHPRYHPKIIGHILKSKQNIKHVYLFMRLHD